MIAVFVGLVILDVLALMAVLRPPRSWVVKLALILGVLAFNFTVLGAQTTARGYPKAGGPPEGSQYVACSVDEPNAIYLWVLPPKLGGSRFGYKPVAGEPRAYRLRYSRALHKECITAQKAASQGTCVGVHSSGGRGRHGRPAPLHFYQLPPPHFQQKGATP